MTTPIPCPPSIPFLGTITSIDRELPVRGLILLARQFGEIFQIRPLQRQVNFVTTAALADELCDEKRFHKLVSGGLEQVRNGAADGLFTAYHGEPSWGIAHRILIPAFGPAAIRDMFEDMVDLCQQLLLKWERFGPDHPIDPTEDYTRLTFDTIALCAMSYRFNSFYMQDMPPFVTAMSRFLTESGNRATRPAVVQSLMSGASAQYAADIKTMNDVTEAVISKRRQHPTEKNDLLNMMLNGKDAQTGLGLTPDNIRAQLITFLIAGHETSSGMASFATYYMLKNPATYAKARHEVDTVLKGEPIRREHLTKLPYLNAVMRETLRLSPSATAIGVTSDEPTTLGQGKYAIDAGIPCVLLLPVIHRDPTVWGPDANEFNPDRMMPEQFEKLPKNAWKPFGNGMRACIGRGFALQEILIALASILQKFDLRLADPTYTLELHQNLTIKPKGLRIFASPRVDGPKPSAGPSTTTQAAPAAHKETSPLIPTTNGKPLYAVYGGNTGSCEGFAQKLAGTAAAHGFSGQVVVLDSLAGSVPKDGPVVIFTASFEGQPADNAAHFVEYLKNVNADELSGVKFAVFGCGNHEWVSTYQAIPRLVDSLLIKAGAQQLLPRAEADAGGDSFFEIFDTWEEKLWPTLAEAFDVKTSAAEAKEEEFVVHVTDTVRAAKLRQGDTGLGKVIENRVLTKAGAPVKRHIEFELPHGTTYRAGDYLAILPVNPPESVRRCLAHFGLLPEQQIIIKSSSLTTLPINDPVSLSELLSGYVELAQPATKKNIQTILAAASDADSKAALESLITDYKTAVFEKRLSVLDVLEMHPQVKLSFGNFIHLLPGMRVRQYSISSSPLWNPEHATLTISVVDAPAISGRQEKFLGVASNYLANLKPGDRVSLSVRPGAEAFHLPSEPEVPIVMFCAGAGLAPMRGFIQERALQVEAGRKVGKAILFVGCRKEDEDYLYSGKELKEWTEKGAVEVRPAFSREADKSLGCKYVQDRVLHERDDIISSYKAGAKFYTCGSLGVSNGVKDACLQIIKGLHPDKPAEWTEEVWAKIQRERYSTDVFG